MEETIRHLITEFLYKDQDIKLIDEISQNASSENIFVHKDGTKRYLDIVSKSILNEDEKVVGIYGSMLDRTELNIVENREIQLRNLVENSKDIIYHYQILPERKFVYLSAAVHEILGHSREDHYNDATLVFKTIHPEDLYLLEKKDRGEVDFSKPLRYRWVNTSGEYIWMEEYTVPIYDDNNKLIAVQAVCRDITQQHLADMEKEKLLETKLEYERLKTEFFSNMSHEFRTPLNIILGSIQLIEGVIYRNESGFSLARLSKYLKMVKQNCYRLLRLINNLIEMSKVDTGFLEINLKNYNIVEVVEDITLSVSEYVKNKGITLIFDTEIEEKIMACDLDKMERVMLNLLSNAIKFTGEKGHIWVTISDHDSEIVIAVKDTGIGIPENMLDKIFDRFRQVRSLLTKAHEGSGIGLSLIKSIVEAHGGKISVKSEYGNGTEFIINMSVKLIDEEETVIEGDFGTKHSKIEKMKVELSDIYR